MSSTAPFSPRLSDEQLGQIVRRLADALAPRAIYLFGSHVYGTPTPDSDVDVLVVLADDSLSTWEPAKRGYTCFSGLGLPVELHFTSAERFARRSGVPGSFEYEVAGKGRLVYGFSPRVDDVSGAAREAAKSEIVREWLDKARRELQTARVALDSTQPLAGIACFHCRQAGEQCLRALLQRHEIAAPKVHDLVGLIDLCVPHEPRMAELRARAEALAAYDEALLYPPAREPSAEEGQRALATAEALCACVLRLLPPEMRP
jgi:HEPN domain-containing protein/predicted nucleotidyltransferase